jgi:polysaccharide export outer membrane protein
MQDAGTQIAFKDGEQAQRMDAILKPGDLLIITVNSNTPEAAQPFNLPLIPGGEGMNSYGISKTSISGGAGLQNYLIDIDGNINFPILGKLKVAGMKKNELLTMLKSKIYPFFMKEEPIVSVRFANYKVSVLGEVNRPGAYNIDNEKLDLFEAIAIAGDLTIYGRRDNILLIREDENGKRTTLRIDLRDKRLIDSPYFYLQQNDVLYIQPNNPRSRGSALGAVEAMSISIVGTLISLTSLIINIIK